MRLNFIHNKTRSADLLLNAGWVLSRHGKLHHLQACKGPTSLEGATHRESRLNGGRVCACAVLHSHTLCLAASLYLATLRMCLHPLMHMIASPASCVQFWSYNPWSWMQASAIDQNGQRLQRSVLPARTAATSTQRRQAPLEKEGQPRNSCQRKPRGAYGTSPSIRQAGSNFVGSTRSSSTDEANTVPAKLL